MTTSGWRGGNGRHPERTAPGLRNHFVYWLYDASDALLYIGCTRRPEQRWIEHQYSSHRDLIARVVRKRMAGPYDYTTARRIEREQQALLKPEHERRVAS